MQVDNYPGSVNDPLLADGPLARGHPALVAFGVLIVGLVAYMAIGSVFLVVFFMLRGASLMEASSMNAALLAENGTTFFAGNALGLALGLGVLAVLTARLQSSCPWGYMRMRRAGFRDMVLALAGLLALLPAIVWLGALNEYLPLPEFIQSMEEEQMRLLEVALTGEGSLFLSIILVAVVPALFEEVFFRGLVQRNLERAWGVAGGIAVTGMVFGLFHLRFTQALPLMVLGAYLAYLAWRTGSLWVPIMVHFANNALALIFSRIVKDRLDIDLANADASLIPWYVAAAGTAIFAAVVVLLQSRNGLEHP